MLPWLSLDIQMCKVVRILRVPFRPREREREGGGRGTENKGSQNQINREKILNDQKKILPQKKKSSLNKILPQKKKIIPQKTKYLLPLFSSLDICWTFAGHLLDICWTFLDICGHLWTFLDICWTFAVQLDKKVCSVLTTQSSFVFLCVSVWVEDARRAPPLAAWIALDSPSSSVLYSRSSPHLYSSTPLNTHCSFVPFDQFNTRQSAAAFPLVSAAIAFRGGLVYTVIQIKNGNMCDYSTKPVDDMKAWSASNLILMGPG